MWRFSGINAGVSHLGIMNFTSYFVSLLINFFMKKDESTILSLPQHLLWEYDLQKFNYKKSFFIVIERVIERGTLEQWREVQLFYGKEKILEVARQSKQLSIRDKQFTEIFVNSQFNAVSR